jgi:hypothetical protein
MKYGFNALLVLSFSFFGLFTQAQTADWKIKKLDWSEADEKSYSEFVSLIGKAVEKRECNSFQSCLKHPNNPYRGSDSDQLKIFADCAKLSYAFRAYFAWKNSLPFSVADDVELRPVPGNDGDKRYSKFGNVVTSRLDFLPKKSGQVWKFVDAVKALNRTIPSAVYSANFRFHYEVSDDEKLFADFYPVDINREAIVPGTNIYDPNGHVAIVYKITDDGKIYFIDAHPDNSLTSGLFGTKFVRSNPGQGAGFKNFRPIKLAGAQFDSALGSYVGGKIVPAKNADLPDFDLVQFFGTDRVPRTDWSKGLFIYEGTKYNYYDYIRLQLSKGNLKLDPVNEIRSLAADLCQTVQDRIEAVDASLHSGVQQKPHPARLPYNIYGTSGEWEEFSTPSRDARLKTSFVELRQLAEDLYNMYQQHDPRLVYNGADIKGDMLKSYMQVSSQCQIVYKKSNAEKVALTLDQVRERLFALSFDPYHCAELRWGASSPQELASCSDDATKRAWYSQERWLRNQIERRYDVRMDFSLEELKGPMPGAGVANPPDVDIVSYLRRAN